jgi:hypothetical protein
MPCFFRLVSWILRKQVSDVLLRLAVSLDSPGERSADDCTAAEESGLKSGMFSGRALAVVFVTDNDPRDIMVTVVSKYKST